MPRRQITMETAGVCIFLLPSPVGRNLLAKCPVSFQQVSDDASASAREREREREMGEDCKTERGLHSCPVMLVASLFVEVSVPRP